MGKSKEELIERALSLKEKEKVKLFKIIMEAYSEGSNIENTINQALIWCDKLCD